ncbi:hypothetical protein WR25_08977 [Diploscapter pachys]|uniref:B9 domain-containing protein 2 n=1 Tax=Diploscapter pachys TaxID=2018661 RepID=A0A2A2M1T5_9BILA|nr:hypothetical protein WR25_08977 [Diploscapter pachys]
MAEVFIIGEIYSAHCNEEGGLACKWNLKLAGGWRVLEGHTEGQSQVDVASIFEESYLAHPIDVHLITKTLQGWPQIHLQLWQYDTYGRMQCAGYGSVFVPSQAGEHKVECPIWRPCGGLRERILHRFVGGSVQLSADPATARVPTIASGTVKLRLSIITRNFDRFGIVA